MGYPETEKLIIIAKKLDVSLDYLLLDEEFIAEKNKVSEKPILNTNGKIAIRAYHGQILVSCHAVKSSNIAFPGKDEPKFILNGVDKVTFWGDHTTILGWYKNEEDIQKEVREITEAMNRGEGTYELKYAAKVADRMIGFPKIIEE